MKGNLEDGVNRLYEVRRKGGKDAHYVLVPNKTVVRIIFPCLKSKHTIPNLMEKK